MSKIKRKNPHAVALGRKGGLRTSPAKTAANRLNILKRWEKERGQQVVA